MKYDPNFILQRNIKNLFNVNGTLEDEQLFELISRVKSDAGVMRKERDEALERVTARDNHILHEINQSASSVITKPLDCMSDVYALVYGLAVSATAPDTTQPQPSEIRYVLHGDIQPCSVLYSDDTTTLLRLDEGDIMCETDTIEWSDSVTYRCQELLKSVGVRSLGHVAPRLAQLVRDERIMLNDNALETSGTVDLKADSDIGVGHLVVPTAVVPAPPPFGHEKPDHNNPYVHTTALFTEEAMRKHGWTSETLVSCGHGYYAPVPRPTAPVSQADLMVARFTPKQER